MAIQQRNAAASDAVPKPRPAPSPPPSAPRSCGPPQPQDPHNSHAAAPLDPRVRSYSSTPRHTAQTAIHCSLVVGDSCQLPFKLKRESHKYLILGAIYLRPSDSVRLTRPTIPDTPAPV